MLHTSPWRVFLIGALLGLALLHQAPAIAQQTTVSNLAWSCTNQARDGQPVTGNSCTGAERWDYGDAGFLVATCASSCAAWQNAIWRPWNEATAQVFICRSPKVPGPWSACTNEGFVARAQVALLPPPPPPPSGRPSSPVTVTITAPPGTWNTVTISWSAVTAHSDGTPIDPATEQVRYRLETCGAVENCERQAATQIALTDLLTWPVPDLAQGTHWFYVVTLLTDLASGQEIESPRSTGVSKLIGEQPFFLYTADPTFIVAGETVTLNWETRGMLGCARSWVPTIPDGPQTPFTGSEIVAPTVETTYTLTCFGPNGMQFSHDATVRIRPAWTPPALPRCWPIDFSKASIVRVVASGDLRQMLTTLGLQEHVSTDGQTSAFGWPCDLSDGYSYQWFVVRHGSTDQGCWRQVSFRSLFTPQFLAAVWEVCSREISEAEKDLGVGLRRAYASRFVVAAIAAGNRAVYLRRPDGTRGAQVVINGVPQTIATGTACDPRRRILGTTTRYCEVSGLLSTNGQVLPANSFTVSTKSDPPVTGWP